MYIKAPTALIKESLNPNVKKLAVIHIKLAIRITKFTLIPHNLLRTIPIPPNPPDMKLLGTKNKLNDNAEIKQPTTKSRLLVACSFFKTLL